MNGNLGHQGSKILWNILLENRELHKDGVALEICRGDPQVFALVLIRVCMTGNYLSSWTELAERSRQSNY